MAERAGSCHGDGMIRTTPVPIPNPPPLWPAQVAHCRTLMRDLGAPAVVIEGRMEDTPFGPRIVATLVFPAAMGEVALERHPAYRLAMRDASAMLTYARMTALNASGIDPVTATLTPESALWQVVVVPAGVALIARTDTADFGPFHLTEHEPDDRQSMLVGRQLSFAGVTVGNATPEDSPDHPDTRERRRM